MKTLEEFKEYFDEEFVVNRKGYNQKLEKATKIASLFRVLTVCFTIMFVATIVVLAIVSPNALLYFSTCGMVVFCLLFAFSYYDFYMKEEVKEHFENMDKEVLVSAILEKDFEYEPRGRMQMSEIKESALFPEFDEVDGEDLVKVNVEEGDFVASFACSDVIIKEITKKDGVASTNVVFQGFYGRAKLNKSIGFDVDINIANHDKTFSKFESESSLFNEHFSVYCKSENKAEKLFRAGLMLALLNLQLAIKTPISLKIRHKDIFICAEKDLFTLDLNNKVLFDSVKNLFNELTGTINIVKEIIKGK